MLSAPGTHKTTTHEAKLHIKGQYETWALIEKLAKIDKLNFEYEKPNKGLGKESNQECPKTRLDNLTIKDHRKLVIH